MHEFDNMEYLNSFLNSGALVVSGGNVMTASWGFIGVMWGKKVAIAAIRDSRFTKELVEETGEFALCVPKIGTMKEELAVCGSKSGRDTDKWSLAKLDKQAAKVIGTPLVADCGHYIECKVIAKLPMGDMDISAFAKWYPTMDMHNFYFGEIVAEY